MEHAKQHDDDARAAQSPRGGSPPGAPPADAPPGEEPQASEVPDLEHRPLGALAVTGFLSVTILVLWFGMYFLNLSRS